MDAHLQQEEIDELLRVPDVSRDHPITIEDQLPAEPFICPICKMPGYQSMKEGPERCTACANLGLTTARPTEFDRVKDSGERQQWSTGAKRDTQANKGRFDLLPPYALYRLARHFENGAVKYDADNWRKGIPLRRYLDSASRHLEKLKCGMADEDHAAAAAWNIICFIETKKAIEEGILPKELDDLSTIQKLMPKEW